MALMMMLDDKNKLKLALLKLQLNEKISIDDCLKTFRKATYWNYKRVQVA